MTSRRRLIPFVLGCVAFIAAGLWSVTMGAAAAAVLSIVALVPALSVAIQLTGSSG